MRSQNTIAWRGSFAQDSKLVEMSRLERRTFMALGRVGLVARAIVFGLVGYFVLKTAIDFKPHETVGLDGALGRLHHQGQPRSLQQRAAVLRGRVGQPGQVEPLQAQRHPATGDASHVEQGIDKPAQVSGLPL